MELSFDERLDYINEDLSLIQLKNGLTFGTDAYLLAAFVGKGKKGADLGAGTGVASLLCITKSKIQYMYCMEIQSRFCRLINKNASLNNLQDKICVVEGDIRYLDSSFTDSSFDVVLSNPPYMPSSGGFDNKNAEMNIARRELNGGIDDFCMTASKLLKHGGNFYTVFRPDRICDLMNSLRKNNLEPKRMVTVYPDKNSSPCLILTESKKGASPSLKQSVPLIIYKDNQRVYTEEMQKVYDTCSLSHLFK